jgi:hypothetical protein
LLRHEGRDLAGQAGKGLMAANGNPRDRVWAFTAAVQQWGRGGAYGTPKRFRLMMKFLGREVGKSGTLGVGRELGARVVDFPTFGTKTTSALRALGGGCYVDCGIHAGSPGN